MPKTTITPEYTVSVNRFFPKVFNKKKNREETTVITQRKLELDGDSPVFRKHSFFYKGSVWHHKVQADKERFRWEKHLPKELTDWKPFQKLSDDKFKEYLGFLVGPELAQKIHAELWATPAKK